MKIKLMILVVLTTVSSISSASGWSGWVSVDRVDLHPDWGVRVMFAETIDSTCNTKMAEWVAINNDIFMNRIISSLLSAKFAKAKVNLWVSDCVNGIARINQTQFQ